jgi:hypothetical protein
MQRGGVTLTLDGLRAETAVASSTQPAYDDLPLERDRPGGSPPDRGGITPGARPSEGDARRRLGNGWKGF